VANTKSSIKRIRSNARKRERNQLYRSRTRTEVKKARTAIAEGNVQDSIAQTKEAIRMLDKAATKGVLHKRNAARRKSRLMHQLNDLQKQAQTPK
jgi:small subunit ribosomal protein S20